jgi:RNA-directed DNA polymerase
MTAQAGAVPTATKNRSGKWKTTDWAAVELHVKRLQMRIAQAWKDGRKGKAKALQYLLSRSYFAKLLAIRRVTQNRGKRTPGVDGAVWKSDKEKIEAVSALNRRGYKSLPLRRVYIPKKNNKKRPLGIPTMRDRAFQALHLLTLEPISESICDPDSYGFRPLRSCADAIEQCFLSLAKRYSPEWILEGDIKSCFDKIDHKWLLNHAPMDKKVLTQWLEAGYLEKSVLHETLEGTPQGGVISPTLLNVTLAGLQGLLRSVTTLTDKVNLIVYADDFVVTGATREVLEDKVKPAIEHFLRERGLSLSVDKTHLTHISKGFDFLGFNVRKYGKKLLIKPSKASITTFNRKIRTVIKEMPTDKTEDLVRKLNPKLRGWANYYRHSVAKDIFSYVDSEVFKAIWKWCKRRHPEKPRRWLRAKYFRLSSNTRTWQFYAACKSNNGILDLYRLSDTPIRRHVKIRKTANPFDKSQISYIKARMQKGSTNKAENHGEKLFQQAF